MNIGLSCLLLVVVVRAISGSNECGMEICSCEVDQISNTATADCYKIKINGVPEYKPVDGSSVPVVELNLGMNMIEKIDELAFSGLTSLKRLLLNNNYLNVIDNLAFGDHSRNYSTSIELMDLSGQ